MERIKKFFQANETRLVLAIGLILVAGLSFEAGLILGKNRQNSPIVIEKSAQAQDLNLEGAQGSTLEAQEPAQEAKISPISSVTPPQECTYVGSKNSNKYHQPTCRYAKLIKPENIVCFSSAEDAMAKNYLPDKGCIK